MSWHCIQDRGVLVTRSLWLLLIGVFILAGAAAALSPVNVAVKSSNTWVTANNTDSAYITVIVTDGSNNAIGGASIKLSVTQPWSLQDTVGTTPDGGQFVTRFLPTTTAGTAVITATVNVPGVTTTPIVQTFSQNIIADLPAQATSYYPGAATVGSLTNISVRVTDKYGNPVDSRKNSNLVTFTGSSSGDSAFLDSNNKSVKVKAISVPLNVTGFADTDFLVSTHPGDNFVAIQPPSPLPMTLISIQGIANAKPASITQSCTPGGNPPTLTTDGKSKFLLNYQLYDQYGNPSIGHNLSISTNAGDALVIPSNSDGIVIVSYGPKTSAGRYTITTAALENPAVTTTQIVQFVSGNPTNMLLTASPQTLASLDVNKDMVSSVMAKVIDVVGNPVPGQPVYFSIQSVNTGAFNQTLGPVIANASSGTNRTGTEILAFTNENGYATVNFYPGSFTTDISNPKYSGMAEGVASIKARWTSLSRSLDLSYKNYPYLSVYTSVNPMTVENNSRVEVSIRLKGDGWALQPKPIDVVLLTDRSGSMLVNETIDSRGILHSESKNDRMVDAMIAARTFVDLTGTTDRIGAVSFGDPYSDLYGYTDTAWLYHKSNPDDEYPYAYWAGRDYNCREGQYCDGTPYASDDAAYINAHYPANGKYYGTTGATVDSPLTFDKNQSKNAIDGLVPSGDTTMRRGIYEAVKAIINDPEIAAGRRKEAVRAIILLTDGAWSDTGGGDPRGGGNSLSLDPIGRGDLIAWAKNNDIKIFTIALGTEPDQNQLQSYATSTGGRFYYAPTGEKLNEIYTLIAGALREEASVDTRMELNFTKVDINGVSYDGSQVLKYEYLDGKSTLMVPPFQTGQKTYTINSTDDWNDDHKLNLILGTIKVDQEWVVNFTLDVLKTGNIKVLGASSQITFSGSPGFVAIPDTYVTSILPGIEGLSRAKLEIRNLTRTNPDSNREEANLTWEISYDGTYDIREDLEVAALNSEAYTPRGTIYARNGKTSDTYTISIADLAPGTYKARVTGSVGDAPPSSDITQFTIPAQRPRTEIVIH